jgi:tryptophan synthase beta chain
VHQARSRAQSQTKFLLDESELPRRWYNIAPDMPTAPQPVLHPGTGEPVGPDDLAPLFPMELIGQEVSQEPEVAIPDEVLDLYSLWRPTPLYRARRLEEAIGTGSRIFYKYEGVSPAGSHKPNTAVAQAFYNKQEGRTRLATETGAGQWGSALSFACRLIGLECKVYMVRVSYEQKPARRSMIKAWGADVVPSPSEETEAGRAILAEHPDSPGSLGIAISEAVEDAAQREDTAYSLGSVLNHVLLHQTVIGQESIEQMELAGEEPDVIIGCAGGGSNFAGLTFPWLGRTFRGGKSYKVIAAEPEAAPSLTRGVYAYDFGDTAKTTPLVKMHTLGADFIPEPIHAGGLRYHGMAPLVSHLKEIGAIEARSVHQLACFAAGVQFARAEGILPAPEPTHALKVAVDEALDAKAAGEERVILFNLCGHGHFDLSAYEKYLAGTLEDYEYPDEAVRKALESLPTVAS